MLPVCPWLAISCCSHFLRLPSQDRCSSTLRQFLPSQASASLFSDLMRLSPPVLAQAVLASLAVSALPERPPCLTLVPCSSCCLHAYVFCLLVMMTVTGSVFSFWLAATWIGLTSFSLVIDLCDSIGGGGFFGRLCLPSRLLSHGLHDHLCGFDDGGRVPAHSCDVCLQCSCHDGGRRLHLGLSVTIR